MIQIFDRGPQHKRGTGYQYQGRQTVTVILTDFELYDELMIKLFELGFNNIRGVHFSLSNPAVEKQKVQLMAIQVAKDKAQLFARELGVELGPVSSFTEQGVHYQPVKYANRVQYDAVQVEGAQGSSIEASKVTIEMTVIVSFKIRTEDE